MNWFFGIALIFVLIFMINNYLKLRKLSKLRKRLKDNWGKPKDADEYFNFDKIRLYFENNKHKEKAFHIISDSESLDLDIDEVFPFLDRTSSKIGQQYLYYKIRTIGSQRELEKFQKLIVLMKKKGELRLESQLLLSKVNSLNSYSLEELINGLPIEKPKIIWLVYLLTASTIATLLFSFFQPLLLILLIPILVANAIFHFPIKNKIEFYLGAISQLNLSFIIVNRLLKKEEIKNHFTDLSFLKTIRFKTNLFDISNKIEQDITGILYMIVELIKLMFNVQYLAFYSFIDSIVDKREDIEKVYQLIGELDSAISVASIRSSGLQICTPVFTTDKKLGLEEIEHPLIANCISNNLILNNKSLLLTGSNMSGKTTFIRTVALNCILAQTLNICFAKKFEAPFLKVLTSIRITDDLLESTSYYLEEVLTIKNLVEASKNEAPCLFVLDEIFKGTNTIERIAAGKAILGYLNRTNHIVLVSTHDIELTELLVKDNYDLYHFSETVEKDELIFDHKLKAGKLKTRNAIKILEMYKYPDSVVEEARDVVLGSE